jgi:Gas vesicle protein G
VGLISGLLTLPLAPVRGVALVAEAIAEEANRELAAMHDPDRALADLEAARAAGEISKDEFDRGLADLVDQVIASRDPGVS